MAHLFSLPLVKGACLSTPFTKGRVTDKPEPPFALSTVRKLSVSDYILYPATVPTTSSSTTITTPSFPHRHPCHSAPTDMDATVVLIGRAVQAASVYTPWRSNCLAQALAAHYMLRRRRLPCTLYIGVAKRPGQSLTAHVSI